MKILLILLTVLGSFVGVSQSLERLIANADQALDANNWSKAESQFRSLINERSRELSPLQRANICNSLADIYRNQQDLEKAELNLRQAINLHEQAGTPNKLDYAEALQNLGLLMMDLTEYDQAHAHLLEALDITIENGKPLDVLVAKTNLASLYEEIGDKRAYEIYKENYDFLVSLGMIFLLILLRHVATLVEF